MAFVYIVSNKHLPVNENPPASVAQFEMIPASILPGFPCNKLGHSMSPSIKLLLQR